MANILIVGKDLADSENFLNGFNSGENKIFMTSSSDISLKNENLFTFSWNKASSISAKTLLIQAETKLGKIDRVLIAFDGTNYANKFASDRIEDCTSSIENMISGYLYFCQTLLPRLAQKQSKVTVGFYLKKVSTKETLTQTKNITQTPCANTVAVAQGAFAALAENFAVSLYQLPHVSVFISDIELSNPLYRNDRETAAWLSGYFNSVESLKTRQSAKISASWVKVGTKSSPSSGFSLFKR